MMMNPFLFMDDMGKERKIPCKSQIEGAEQSFTKKDDILKVLKFHFRLYGMVLDKGSSGGYKEDISNLSRVGLGKVFLWIELKEPKNQYIFFNLFQDDIAKKAQYASVYHTRVTMNMDTSSTTTALAKANFDPALTGSLLGVVGKYLLPHKISGSKAENVLEHGGDSFIILRDVPKKRVRVNGEIELALKGGWRGFKNVPPGEHTIQLLCGREWSKELKVVVSKRREAQVFRYEFQKKELVVDVENGEHYGRLALGGSMDFALFDFPKGEKEEK